MRRPTCVLGSTAGVKGRSIAGGIDQQVTQSDLPSLPPASSRSLQSRAGACEQK